MKHVLRIIIITIAVSAILPVSMAGGEPAPPRRELVSLRHWTAPEHTRIVLDMSSECIYQVSERSGPNRIVIDIPKGRLAAGLRKFKVGDGVIDRVRVNRLSNGAQVVIDLPAKSSYKHFALKPNNIHPRHRIVIDVNRTISVTEKRKKAEKARRVAQSGDYVVIIDPGHGGSKPGASSKYGPSEKYYTLPLSKLIAEEIEKHRGFKAVLTRKGDYDVGLYRRIEIAKQHGGHCFVSVHLNSPNKNNKRKLRGSEVYYLTREATSDKHAASVAEKENMDFGEDVNRKELNGDVEEILYNMLRNNAYNMSSVLASHMALELNRMGSIPFRGIRQGNILVLRGIEMPSVLVEVAYLSSKSDVTQIKKKSVQRKVAKAVA
ncbi:MAG: N-acetylmuramoyl-L-alanine amidase, partial [Candidatus Krumholzibacteria bacterium]|nr:N-acetylmuramoyl-L-alanine amidase [Candidatus Krumholzibacteria bacterium]